MSYQWGSRSLRNLDEIRSDGVRLHPELRRLADLVLARSKYDLSVLDAGALRTLTQAQANVASGTGVLNSRHLTGHALDLVPYHGRGVSPWPSHHPEPERHRFWDAFKSTAELVGIVAAEIQLPIVQGCDWDCDGILGESGEYDWPHLQIPWPHQQAKAEALLKIRRMELNLL